MNTKDIIEIIVSLCTLAIAIYGVFFGIRQYKRNVNITNEQLVANLIDKIRNDVEVKEMIQAVDYNTFIYDRFFHTSKNPLERKLDKTLTYFTQLVYMKELRIVMKRNFAIFEFEILRIISNEHIQNYLYNIYHFSKKCGANCPFEELIKFGVKMKIIDENIYDKEAYKKGGNFAHYLNF